MLILLLPALARYLTNCYAGQFCTIKVMDPLWELSYRELGSLVLQVLQVLLTIHCWNNKRLSLSAAVNTWTYLCTFSSQEARRHLTSRHSFLQLSLHGNNLHFLPAVWKRVAFSPYLHSTYLLDRICTRRINTSEICTIYKKTYSTNEY